MRQVWSRGASARQERGVATALLIVLAVSVIALSPSIFLGKIPADTYLYKYFGPWTTSIPKTSNTLYGGDSFYVYLPDMLEGVQDWKKGQLPLWNPYVNCGMPILGMQTANVLDPLILLVFLMPLGNALGLAYALLLFIAGSGLVFFLRDQGLRSSFALALAGVSFVLCPYFIQFLPLRVFLGGLATLTWALWALDGLVLGARGPRGGVLALAVGYAVLAGTLQTLALFLLVLGIRLLWNLFLLPREQRRAWARPLGMSAGFLLVGLCIGALPLLAGTELLGQSTRFTGNSNYYAGSNFFHWRAFALWFSPDALTGSETGLFGAWDVFGRTLAAGAGWGRLGFVPLWLATLALIWRAGPRRERYFWGGLAAANLAFLLLLGISDHRWLTAIWPSVDTVDFLRGLIVVNLAGSILVGWGARWLEESWKRGEVAKAVLALAALGVLTVLGIVAARSGLEGLVPIGRVLLLPLFTILSALALVWLARRPAFRRLGWGLLVLVALELGVWHFRTTPFSPKDRFYPYHPVLAEIGSVLGPPAYYRFMVHGTMRVLPPNIPSMFDLSDVRGYSNIPMARFRLLLECAEGRKMWNIVNLNNVGSPIYRLLGCAYVFMSPNLGRSEPALRPVRLRNAGAGFFARRDPLPRAFLVHRVVTVADETEMRAALANSSFDPGREVYLQEDSDGRPPPVAPPTGPELAAIQTLEPDQVTVTTETTAPGVLVLTDPFYPGWRARMDGHPVEILPADWGLRGVSVSAGSHTVTFSYRPAWLMFGILLSLLGLAAALAACFPGVAETIRLRRTS